MRGERPLPLSGGTRALVHQLEIPYGYFERRIALPAGRFEMVGRGLIEREGPGAARELVEAPVAVGGGVSRREGQGGQAGRDDGGEHDPDGCAPGGATG